MKNINVDQLLKTIFESPVSLDVRERFNEKIEEYGITRTRALKLLNVDKDVFDQIISGKAKQPNLIHIVKIAEFLDIQIDDFIQIVLSNQSSENISSIDRARKVTFLMKNFDVKTLTKMGFFEHKYEIDILLDKVLTFFGYGSINEFERGLVEPLFSRAKRSFSDKMKDFWVRSAYQTFKHIDNPNEYDRNQLKEIVVNMKPYSQDVKSGLLVVFKALYSVGVTVILQSYLSTTHVRGGTFAVNGKPCIVLTDYNKKYPTIWFTLMHELHHVLFDFDMIKTNSFHLSGDDDLFLVEEKADNFARDYFLPLEKFQYIKTYINNRYMVARFAKENEIHISLVYSFFTWYQKNLYNRNYHAAFKEFYPDYQDAVAKLNPVTWQEESLKVASDKIKSVFEIK
ncbi:MAG TPA: helix-turn-helix transcriptional regulator [Candidatus Sphingobacterium stercoripullorum]|uniref:Helix-turn-helix transcriptional regulator n=1 Tax=Candidatus Sphingobacterium stercoripullorum TaxID=2838759 RepID=A0A9D2AYI1_9SPHI|nr:helix-turn-helix transcriptional regulator [Candidatus Sphingobacterium stercoripullorum]